MVAEDLDKVKVVIRVRPINKREQDLRTKCVVDISEFQTVLHHPIEERNPKTFAFDHCFDSSNPSSSGFATQEDVFALIGADVVDNAFLGYNACIFAYGQTGSGKSYTMMGSSDNPGITPRLCNAIFEKINCEADRETSFKVEVSYMEIYNEKVRDLLDPKNSSKRPLKVREHNILGPIVDGLSVLAVSTFDQIACLMDEGNKSRTVAATNMNAESSRSHAVFTIRLTQIMTDAENSFTGEKVSKISLVDLAGSERAQKTGAMGKRLEEGANINKSLTTLGMVISALAERTGKKEKFVPYRDSVLTWLLKDNLGGNSKTIMVATISPAADNYEETLSTLRYADRAKKIVNHAVVNEDPNAKIIRELREEVETLRQQISQNMERQNEAEELRERLAESERFVEQMNKSWEDRLKETEIVSKQRQKDLEEIGISVAESGIKVEKDRFYLVNLNADPSLNELLVYYINQRAIVGNGEVTDLQEKVDFVLQGLGVHPRHALLEVCEEEGHCRLYVVPLSENARICVNGDQVEERTQLRNGYRLLIGNNHFFRVNCPKDGDTMTASMSFSTNLDEASFYDYDRAWLEANNDEPTSNPVSSAVDQYIEKIAIKHQEEKQAALEKQYEEFERYLQGLSHSLQTPSTPMNAAPWQTPMAGTPSCQLPPVSFASQLRNNDRSKFFKWAQKREELFKESLNRLKTEIVRAHALAREANMIAEELWGNRRGLTHYDVTLQIPAANLRPSKIKAGNSVCEPVIVVKRNGMAGFMNLWTIEQLHNKLIDMREMYNERMCSGSGHSLYDEVQYCTPDSSGLGSDCSNGEEDDGTNMLIDTLFESQEKHTLIGVANVFLEVLFHELRLDYQVPIISQQGEVCGKLHVEIYRLPDVDSDSMTDSSDSLGSGGRNSHLGDAPENSHGFLGRTIRCRIRIKKATNLPIPLSHFVFCQYSFFNVSEMLVVAPSLESDSKKCQKRPSEPSSSVKFDHQKDFSVCVTEEFLEYVQEDALSIEIWGHRNGGFDVDSPDELKPSATLDVAQKQKSVQERWAEVTKRLEVLVDIKEMNENGEYASVEVSNNGDVPTGGIYQLRQGQQRRITVRVRPIPERGLLPLSIGEISSVAIGSMVVRAVNGTDRPLDTYQEVDLDRIREQWSQALNDRQRYLEAQINSLTVKTSNTQKSPSESEREQSLINQWVALTEERNAVSVPTPNSNIPGAPAEWEPPTGIEKHVPVVFLDLNADDLTAVDEVCDYETEPSMKIAGLNSVLPFERFEQMVLLPILERDTLEMTATCSWDSSIHSCQTLNKPSAGTDLIYGIVRITVRLLHPFAVDLILRKRICMNIYKKPSFTERLMRKIVGAGTFVGTGIHYDVVAHIPKSSLDMEDRSSLAMMAARHVPSMEDDPLSHSSDISQPTRTQSTYIEAYTKSIQAVEWMLKLDRLRQESAMCNTLSRQERAQRLSAYGPPSQSFRMKRAVSLPSTMNNVSLPPIPPRMNNGCVHDSQLSPQPEIAVATNRLMEMSTSASSGYSSMVSSFVSPTSEQPNSKLSGIDEEQVLPCETKEPVRSVTVPATLHSANCHTATQMSADSPSSEDNLNGNGLLQCSKESVHSRTNRLFEGSDERIRNNNGLPPLPPRYV